MKNLFNISQHEIYEAARRADQYGDREQVVEDSASLLTSHHGGDYDKNKRTMRAIVERRGPWDEESGS